MSTADSPLRGRVVFNVGSRRSGTFWLQRIVTAHPNVDAVPPETHLFSHGLALLFDRVQHRDPESMDVGTIWADREILVDATRDLCDRLLAPFASAPGNLIAERTPVHAFHLELISELYPDAKVVHIIRDGRDVARSLARQAWGPNTIGGAAAEWRSAVLAARGAGLPAERYRELRYEALLSAPEPEIKALLEWLELPTESEAVAACVDEARRAANVDASTPDVGTSKWRAQYSQDDLDAFLAVAGDLLGELGYDVGERPTSGRTAAETEPPDARAHGRRGRRLRRRQTTDALADIVASGLAEGRAEAIVAALTSEACVSVFTSGGAYEVGAEGAAAVVRWFAGGEGAFRGRQVERSVYPGEPWTAVVVSREAEDGSLCDDAFLLRAEGGSIAQLVLYSFPRDARGPVAIGMQGR